MRNSSTRLVLAVIFLVVCFASTAHAQTIRRCNNLGLTGPNIYATVQAAHDAASNGDIIYLEPTSITYGDLTCTKVVTIIGTGYFLAQNPGLQLDLREALLSNVFFNTGSAGSRITGCHLLASYLAINASNVIVERNQLSVTTYVGYTPTTGANNSINNILIRHNYCDNGLVLYPGGTSTVSNTIISNNIVIGSITTSGSYTGLNNILITNNVIGNAAGNNGATLQVDNSVIKNNILTFTSASSNFTPRNNAYSYNISANAVFGTANGNQQNVAPTALFVGGTASNDGAYQLRAGTNPARGTGENGIDIGAYGGLTPYRLSGIPNVPTIYQYNQSVTGNTLNATISTRSNN
ncbi:hypothetical protein [Hymenobacter volaticus]|uniref:Right handed beta helix domain-containing protein n=1 Tax=Hymenobacter volaticus TaxID=2932254 RepID=A0ABY4GE20_9BACT|nr:hypothetical protein [Hymenobacter volaticus]UOQ69175.1 hypothetical protein MUN86_26025 [Hymenobacter volaticus]